ncbi:MULTISPECIES: winged helix-turn-helix transcriptional regulator [Sphingomonas]|jgi:DNA-binding HxlR family transcriptional regulator|uniref:Transcriptional regulator n=3 Tax=Sphingomonas TaxID=13687 RepID=A0A0D1MFY9_9SPHN|nr:MULTISPECIES: helix-turn-helix domain-containing protein [Sphingomonas]MCI1141816.1 helix-turn-helix transcriptional regulator [Sphingomonas sp. WKB10]ANC86598.1 transcriptional regulator [Sphingomonas sp. NIC1]AOW22524.1 transcriptional regulator [Sphingomonas melonis TY]KIU26531.1 transcriptional regulator [Sphingomonas melonis]KZB95557.1 transcriptional regulator [Sphingomonas melonis TY]
MMPTPADGPDSACTAPIRETLRETLRECSLPAALEAMGERWAFLILRAAFNGLHHFEEFQAELGIARNILANRLGRLVDHGILQREAMPADRRKIRYTLTEKGHALLPTMIALRQWGERWELCAPAFPILVDARDRRPIAPVAVQAHDGRILGKGDLIWALPEDVDDPT